MTIANAASGGKQNPPISAEDELVPASQVRRELGDISAMSLWRYDRFPDKAPSGWRPMVKLGARNYQFRSVLDAVKRNLRAANAALRLR